MKCEHCGALLAPNAMTCGYCRAPTAAARQAEEHARYQAQVHAQQQAQYAAAATQQERYLAQMRLQGTATHSLWWSIVSFVICCLPISIIGLVQALRARTLAKTLGAPLPTNAVLGLVLSSLSLLTVGGFYVSVVVGSSHDQEHADARIAALDAQTATTATNATLSHPTACALAESYLLKNGHATSVGSSVKSFDCVGQVTQADKRADLGPVRFSAGGTKYAVHACFAVGARWYVSSVQDAPCAEAPAKK